MKFAEFMKKQSIGFYLVIVMAILSIVGISLYSSVEFGFLDETFFGRIITCWIIAMFLMFGAVIFAQFEDRINLSKNIKKIIESLFYLAAVILFAVALTDMIYSAVEGLAYALSGVFGDKETGNFVIAVLIVQIIAFFVSMVIPFFKQVKKAKD